jgi:cellulose synthase/poly-beta-1,6-N-acetylglucosamine synthase-like glycosyltransferase
LTSVLSAVAIGAVVVLLLFTLRRAVFVGAALVPRRSVDGHGAAPSVALLVPARNEAASVGSTLDAIARLDYPSERLVVVLINDGSSDETGERFHRWAARHPRTRTLDLPQPVGKFEALNRAVGLVRTSDVIAVLDADLRPHATWLRRLVAPFADERVGGTAGFISPVNAERNTVTRYAAVESWVHQLITSVAKDRLGLNPPTLGASAYRRTALEGVGLFSGGSGGDVRSAAALTRAGWRLRFVHDAVVDNTVVEQWSDYWHQHVRWARNVFSTVRFGAPLHANIGLAAHAEEWMAAAGYTDRIALLIAASFAVAGRLPQWTIELYAAVAVAEVAVAIAKAGRVTRVPLYLFATACLFVVDLAASAAAAARHLARGGQTWRQPPRTAIEPERSGDNGPG